MGGLDSSVLNKEGVSWSLLAQNQEAVTHFENALVAMKKKASLLQVPEHNQPTSPRSCPTPMCGSVELPIQEERFCLCSRAMVFTAHNKGATSEMEFPLHSALILFGIALAHHLRKQGCPADRTLRDAAHFCTMCSQILAAVEAGCNKSSIAPVKLAALNNLAVIHCQRGNARRGHSVLRETCELLTPILGLDRDAFGQDDFDGIALNAAMMKWTFAGPCAQPLSWALACHSCVRLTLCRCAFHLCSIERHMSFPLIIIVWLGSLAR